MANKDRGSTFSFRKRPSTRLHKQQAAEISSIDTLRSEFRGTMHELKNSGNKYSTGRFSNSTENLTDADLDEEGYTIQPPPPTFLGNILRGIEKSQFQELVDQIPDEKPLSRDEMNFLNGKRVRGHTLEPRLSSR